jgi:hypothetical protein
LKVVLDGPAFSKRCPGFSKRKKIPNYSARASNTIVLFVTVITAMFSMMDRLLPVSDIATMARRLFLRQTNRKHRMHDVNPVKVRQGSHNFYEAGFYTAIFNNRNAEAHLLFARNYRLSTAALLIGISGGLLYALHDSWTYTYMLKNQIQSMLFMRLFTGKTLKVFCSGDICRTEKRI